MIQTIEEIQKILSEIHAVGKEGTQVTHPEHFTLERARKTLDLANKANMLLLDLKNKVGFQSTENLADRLYRDSCDKGEWSITEQVGKETHSYINPSMVNNSEKLRKVAINILHALLDPLHKSSVWLIKACTQDLLVYCRAHNINLYPDKQ